MRMLAALRGEPLDRPPVWMMRQAGRYLPEYRELRARHSFTEAMRSPEVAAEITLQPLRRFELDGAIVFADIMTPLAAMGVDVEFAPGPRLVPLSIEKVARLPELEPAKIDYVAEAIARVRSALEPEIALIGFAGAPLTLLAYLLEGGGSQQWPGFRAGLHGSVVEEAVAVLGRAMGSYLSMQIAAGADLVQIFDTWAGLLPVERFVAVGVPTLSEIVSSVAAPSIYFAPGGGHLLEMLPVIGCAAIGVDWRQPMSALWERLPPRTVLQGNLDPAVLLTEPAAVRRATARVLADADRPGHIFNLGHGVLPGTPVENVAAMVDTVVTWRRQ